MRVSIYLTFLLSLMSLGGCGIGGHWMNGDPSAGKNVKPYGAHWVKEGMTRESRREDLAACGSVSGNEDVRFKDEQVEAARQAGEPNTINAYLKLRDILGQCMSERGYQPVGDLKYLGGCDERCTYP